MRIYEIIAIVALSLSVINSALIFMMMSTVLDNVRSISTLKRHMKMFLNSIYGRKVREYMDSDSVNK